nr:putative ribonuclease H-like domain-containing protein [Tanacetum cinerariifolium]
KPLTKDEEAADVDVHLYRSMIGSLMYLTASRPDIIFVACACFRFQVTPKTSHLHAVKMIFRYLKGKPKLGLWYPKVSSFDLEAYSNSDYAGANLDRKSTTRGCQFLGTRLISWQCKKQTVVATSTTEAEYVAAANCCGHYFIRDAYEKKLIQVLKIHTNDNVADLLTKAFDVSSIEERAKFLAETIVAQRRFRAAQRFVEIRSRPPTKSQLRNLMMTYLKNMSRTFTIVRNRYPLTRTTSTKVVLAKETSTRPTQGILVYSRRPKANRFVGYSSKVKIVESKTSNSKEPKQSWGSIVSNVPSSSLKEYSKVLGTVRFGNDHFAKIMGYRDYQMGNVTISQVYYMEGLGHNLFSVGQFYDFDLKVIPLMNAGEFPEMDPYKEVVQQGQVHPLLLAYIPDPMELDEHVLVHIPEPEHPEYHAPLDDDVQVEDEDEDPEKDPSEEHEPEDDDEDPEEDLNEEHEPDDEDAKEPSEDYEDTEPFEEDKTAVTPSPPRHRRARISVKPQTPMVASTQALIDAFPAGSSPFPLPPTSPAYDQAPLGHRAAMIRMRDDIPEEDMPHRRRFVLTAPPPGCNVAESSAAAKAPRGQYDFVDTVEAGQGLIRSPSHDARTIARAADRAEDVGY